MDEEVEVVVNDAERPKLDTAVAGVKDEPLGELAAGPLL